MGVLRNRNYAILFYGQMVSILGDNLYKLALPWFIYVLTASKTDLAITGVTVYAPAMLSLFVGVFVDRWSKKWTMIVSDILRTAISVALCVLALMHGSFLMLMAMVLVMEAVGTFFGPAETALIPVVVTNEEIPGAMGLNQSASSVMGLIGKVGGGLFISVFGAPVLFLLNGLSYGISVLSLLFVRAKEPDLHIDAERSLLREWKEGTRVIFMSPQIRRVVFTAVIVNFGMAAMTVVITAWVKTDLHGSGTTFGLVQGVSLIGGILGGLLLPWFAKRVSVMASIRLGLLLLGVCAGAIGIIASTAWTMSMEFITGVTGALINGSLGVVLIQSIPDYLRGRVLSTFSGMAMLSAPLGIGVFGALLARGMSTSLLFALMGLTCILGGILACLPVKGELVSMDVSG